jgi:hypothetical protein
MDTTLAMAKTCMQDEIPDDSGEKGTREMEL